VGIHEPTSARQESCELWPCHQRAFELFMRCTRQFHLLLGGMGGAHWRAVSPGAVAQEMAWMGVLGDEQRELRTQYLVMEDEALRLLNERETEAARKA
jgi:hypothetical protein